MLTVRLSRDDQCEFFENTRNGELPLSREEFDRRVERLHQVAAGRWDVWGFRYKFDPLDVYRFGFMADEVGRHRPDAVARGPGGYLMLNYEALASAPPDKPNDLAEATRVILEREEALGPEAFEVWLRERPGAVIIYAWLAEGQDTEQAPKAEPTGETGEMTLGAALRAAGMLDERGALRPMLRGSWPDAL